jgi:adenylate cyclase
MSSDRVVRRLAAILAADVAGYSRLMGLDEEGTLASLKTCRRELIDPKIAEYRGRIVKAMGDGVLAEFTSVVDAVRCAVDIQPAAVERNATIPKNRRLEFRMGINVGDIIVDEADFWGWGQYRCPHRSTGRSGQHLPFWWCVRARPQDAGYHVH